MNHIVLDTNIIINYPNILSYKRNDTKVIVPDVVLKQIMDFKSPRRKRLAELLNTAQDNGIITFSSVATPKENLTGNMGIDFTDYSIAGYAKFLQEEGNSNVILATDDRALGLFASSNGIKTFNSSDLIAFFAKNSNRNNTISDEADIIENKERWSYLINIIVAILFLIAFVFFIRNFDYLIDKLSNIFWIFFLPIIGFGLFEIRQKKRQLYGFVEIGIGILTIVVCYYPELILINWDFYLKIIAGLYVIVRGLDNLYIGSEKKSFESVLKKLFKIK